MLLDRVMNVKLDYFFNPRSVAIIGASRTPGKVGYEIVRTLKTFYKGKIYPCLLYTSPSPRDLSTSRMPSSA